MYELRAQASLTAEAVQGAALPLEGIDHIHGGDSLPLGVFGVGDGIPDDVLKEDLEDTTGLLIDEARDTLDTTTTCQTTDGGLGDALDVVRQNLAVTLGASLSESLASFAATSHVDELFSKKRMMHFRQEQLSLFQFGWLHQVRRYWLISSSYSFSSFWRGRTVLLFWRQVLG